MVSIFGIGLVGGNFCDGLLFVDGAIVVRVCNIVVVFVTITGLLVIACASGGSGGARNNYIILFFLFIVIVSVIVASDTNVMKNIISSSGRSGGGMATSTFRAFLPKPEEEYRRHRHQYREYFSVQPQYQWGGEYCCRH